MKRRQDFTEGKILQPLLRFTLPILFALCLQAMYGAVDLLVVGWFGTAADVSAVATGSQMMQTMTTLVTGLAMGTTVLLGQKLGQKKDREAGDVIGGAICLFGVLAAVLTAVMLVVAPAFAALMHAPEEAFARTVEYVRICSGGAALIVAYNVLGSVFRGLGDSKTPLLAVGIACVGNMLGDLLFVGVFGMAAAGAALATVLAQGVSVVLCVLIIRKRGLPFPFSRKNVGFHGGVIGHTLALGIPIALQNLLVDISFLVILSIVNGLGVTASAGVGVAEKLCAFIMLVPGSYMQSLSAFVAQNIGAGKQKRAKQAMVCGMLTSFLFGLVLAWLGYFHGDLLSGLFAKGKPEVIAAAADYLKAYAIDTLLTSYLFCFAGYFNGCGQTGFVMAEGLVGAFGIRIPMSFVMSRMEPVSLFRIGLASPAATIVQVLLCVVYFLWSDKKQKSKAAA